MSHKIFASILSANFAFLGKDINAVLSAGADGIHFDVMDNHFVPNLTIGPDVCKSLRNYGIKCFIDVHLMVSPLGNLATMFADAGADAITFHVEAVDDVQKTIAMIKGLGCKVGIALNPSSNVDDIVNFIEQIDNILVMSVEPGFGGQKFIPSVNDKIIHLRKIISENNYNCDICIDGGINNTNVGGLKDIGVDNFVVGSALFKSENYSDTITELRKFL